MNGSIESWKENDLWNSEGNIFHWRPSSTVFWLAFIVWLQEITFGSVFLSLKWHYTAILQDCEDWLRVLYVNVLCKLYVVGEISMLTSIWWCWVSGKQTLGHRVLALRLGKRVPDLCLHAAPLWLWPYHTAKSPWGQGYVLIQSLQTCSRPLWSRWDAVIPCPVGPNLLPRLEKASSSGASSHGQILLLVCTPGTKEWLIVEIWMEFRSPGVPVHAIVRLLETWDLAGLRRSDLGSQDSKFILGIPDHYEGMCVSK